MDLIIEEIRKIALLDENYQSLVKYIEWIFKSFCKIVQGLLK
uniref:Uncharacterized protein n=1 Tax=Lepeophtheirus salmonis TaxID=72036 RepID=A0A0K2UCT3_LEPSM